MYMWECMHSYLFLHEEQYYKHYSEACFFFTLLYMLELILYQNRDNHIISKIPCIYWPLPNLCVLVQTPFLSHRLSNCLLDSAYLKFVSNVPCPKWNTCFHLLWWTLLSVYPTTSKVRAPFPQLLCVLAANGSQLPPSLESCLQLKWPTLSGSDPEPTTDILGISTSTKLATSHDLKISRGLLEHKGCFQSLFRISVPWNDPLDTEQRDYVSAVFLPSPVTHLLKVTLQRINSPLLLVVSLGPFGTSFEFRNGDRSRDVRCGPGVEVRTEPMSQWWWRQSEQPGSGRRTRSGNLRRCIQCLLLKAWVATYLDIQNIGRGFNYEVLIKNKENKC